MNPLDLIKLLSPKAWAAVGVAVLLAFAGLQTVRLHHAKADLSQARSALLNPATKRTWQSEALASVVDLGTCRANTDALQAAVARQNAAAEVLQAESDRRAKMLSDGLQEARKGRVGAEQRAAALLTHGPVGADACVRAEAAREAVLKALQP